MGQATLETLAQADIERPKDDTGAPQPIPATWDSGYDSEAAAQALEALGFDPSRATGRTRPQALPAEPPESPGTAKAQRAAQVQRPTGRALYARRKVIVEPVCGQIKEGRGFRRFLLRGLDNIRGGWRWGGVAPKRVCTLGRRGRAGPAAARVAGARGSAHTACLGLVPHL